MKEIKRYVFNEENLWLNARDRVFTSSEVNRLMADIERKMTPEELIEFKKDNPKSKRINIIDKSILSDGAITYIVEKISAQFGLSKFVFTNIDMQHGKDLEPVAALYLCDYLGLNPSSDDVIYTSHNGTVFFTDSEIGGTPDIILPKLKAIAEIKCPNSQTHLYNKLFLTPDNFATEYPVYYDQMQMNMYLTDSEKCYFISFDDRFEDSRIISHIIIIDRNQVRIDAILDKVSIATAFKNNMIKKLIP